MPIASILQSLFSTALGRAVPIVFQKIVRRSKVDAAMRGELFENSAIKKAMRDYEVIVGSTYGLLTETLDRFLRCLESSGIVVVMAEEAVIHRRTDLTRQAFDSLHAEIFGPSVGDSATLYNQIATSFEASLELLVSDPTIALLINSVAKDLGSRVDRIEECAAALARTLPSQNDHAEIHSTFQKLNRGLATRFKDIRVETNRGGRHVSIDRIYIPSKLRIKKEPQTLKEILAASKTNRERELQSEQELTRITFSEFRSGFRRAVVLGDPGGGKSTLCQYLCFHLCRQFNLAEQADASEGKEIDGKFDAQYMKIPLRVVLRSFESARVTSPQLTLLEYIANDLRSVANALAPEHVQEFLRHVLGYGYAVLAFDGLDEILNTSTRRDFVDLVTAFCDEFPLCPVFVTSRVVGYEDAPLRDDFEEFTLEKFDDKEVTQYVTKFLKVFDNDKQAQASERANAFLQQTQGTASDLRQNPLMLGLMAFLFATKGDVPNNRPEIYKECSILMFEKWDQNRNIRADIPVGFDMLHLFGEIASEIYGDPKLEEGVNEKWIRQRNNKYFMNIYEDRARAYEASKKVTEFVTGRSWVMSEFGPNNYRFTHRTFMEYFFATHLDESNETVPELLDALLPHVKKREWDVISHLAVQMKTFRNQKRTAQAIECLKEIMKRDIDDAKSLLEVVSFFANALGYLIPSEMDCKVAVFELMRASFRIVQQGDTEAARKIIFSLCACVIERRPYIQNVIAELLQRGCEDQSDRSKVAFCAMLLSDPNTLSPFNGPESVPLASDLRKATQANLKEGMKRRALKDSSLAHVYSEWYRDSFAELYSIHGLPMLIDDLRPWQQGRLEPNLFISILLGLGRRYFPKPFQMWARDALETIGQLTDSDNVISLKKPLLSRFFIPSHVWIQAISNSRSSVHALRGVLIFYCLLDDRLNESEKNKPSGRRPWTEANGTLRQHISRVLRGLTPQDAKSFDFWPSQRLMF